MELRFPVVRAAESQVNLIFALEIHSSTLNKLTPVQNHTASSRRQLFKQCIRAAMSGASRRIGVVVTE
jgi:hypothetical protein